MSDRAPGPWIPFRPTPEELQRIAGEVADVREIQETLLERHDDLHVRDRVAHEYQIAGSPVRLRVADELPPELEGVGLFEPGAEHPGIGRVSTGLGTPHVEPGLDFLGLMLAFRTAGGRRVDFLAINHPAAPTDDHRQFVDVLHATAGAADAGIPFVGHLGDRDLVDTAAVQTEFFLTLRKRMGFAKALKTAAHLIRQTQRTFHSDTAYQAYWTGVVEVGGTAGKFTMVPIEGEVSPEAEGERRLTEDWRKRQAAGDVEFQLHWIPFLDEDQTPTDELTEPWEEGHRRLAGTVIFPRLDLDSREGRLWADLAAEMGANPGHWVRDREDTVEEPGTEFGAARKIAYGLSQEGRAALDPELYADVFRTGEIGEDLARELERRRREKEEAGHVDRAPAGP